jgi:uncharacterized protein (AIM24 family)
VSRSGWTEQPPIRDMARLHFGRSTCQISGAYVPVAEMSLDADDSVYFSHHVLLHTDPRVRLSPYRTHAAHSADPAGAVSHTVGGPNRRRAGMPLIMMTAQGPGNIAFSENHPGEVIAVPLQRGQEVEVIEHRFLLATGNIGYSWEPARLSYSVGERIRHPLGETLDRFLARHEPGLLLLHAPGNTFIRDLSPGERILVQPSALVWKDPSVSTGLHFEYPGGSYSLTSAELQVTTVWLALVGPGRVAISSVFERPETVGHLPYSRNATWQRW